jgi:hypothetical protein
VPSVHGEGAEEPTFDLPQPAPERCGVAAAAVGDGEVGQPHGGGHRPGARAAQAVPFDRGDRALGGLDSPAF